MKGRITPENIESLRPNEIIVFGSNGSGRHDGGLAKICKDKFGAIYGQSYGLQGQSFGINTMDGDQKMALDVNGFIGFAKQNSNLTFLLTKIGCGIAGFTEQDIAPMLYEAIKLENIHLPESFWKILNQ